MGKYVDMKQHNNFCFKLRVDVFINISHYCNTFYLNFSDLVEIVSLLGRKATSRMPERKFYDLGISPESKGDDVLSKKHYF